MESNLNQLLLESRAMIPLHIEDLPTPILLDILLRLPVQSLGLLTCVSKFWYSIISDSSFVDVHLSHRLRNPGYLFTPYDSEVTFVERVEDIVEGMDFSLGRLAYRVDHDAIVNSYESSGGLLAYLLHEENCYYICNPITGEQAKVPHDPQVNYNGEVGELWWGFSYSTTTKEYKLVEYTRPWRENLNGDIPRCTIYTLGSESWREIPNFPFIRYIISSTECNGTLYWLADGLSPSDVRKSLWSIDIDTEQLRCMQGPPYLPAAKQWYYLVRFGDTISSVVREESRYAIWILRDKVNETWIHGYNFDYEQNFNFWGLWTSDHLFGTMNKKDTCVAYDPDKKEFRDVLPCCKRLSRLPYIPRCSFFHAGSLVSPTRVMAGVSKFAAGERFTHNARNVDVMLALTSSV